MRYLFISEKRLVKNSLLKFYNFISVFSRRVRRKIELKRNEKIVTKRNKQKVFVIGFNKTGTTSTHLALKQFDLIIGNQIIGEKLLDDIIEEDYNSLIKYCKSAEAFQDIPFSLPNVYKICDENFPNSKFILTIRDDEKQWFNSLKKFHTKLWATNGSTITKEDLGNAFYIYKGYPLKAINFVYGESYYNYDHYTQIYNRHNDDVKEYFKDRPDDLLVINVADMSSYKDFCEFLNEESLQESFSWANKTTDLK